MRMMMFRLVVLCMVASMLPAAMVGAQGAEVSAQSIGLTLGPIPQGDPRHGTISGVYVSHVKAESAAARVQIRQGDIIVSAGRSRTPVSTADEFNRILGSHEKGKPFLVEIRRDGAPFPTLIQTP